MTLKSGWCLTNRHRDRCKSTYCDCPCHDGTKTHPPRTKDTDAVS